MPEYTRDQIRDMLISDQVVDGLIKFLEEFFSTFPQLTWDSDETKTKILIHDFDAFNLESVDKRPRIAVELVESRWNNLLVNNMQKWSFIQGTKEISDLVQSTVTLHCISQVSLEAKNIADIVFEMVRIFREELRRETGFFEVDSVYIGREQRVRTSSQPEVRSVPITLKVLIQRRALKILDRQKYMAFGP